MRLATKTLLGIGALALVATLGTLFGPKAVKAATALLVQDIDQPARAPFATTVSLNAVTNFNYTQVPIPTGQRLVIDYVSISGAAQSVVNNTVEPIQPIIILNTSVAGGPANLYYLAPPQNNQLSTQFYMAQPTTIYADTLEVGPAFAGFTPTFDVFNVVISGHLISNP